ncbi:MAG: hypothetical protein ACRCVT_09015 [Leadbetterella sp.]
MKKSILLLIGLGWTSILYSQEKSTRKYYKNEFNFGSLDITHIEENIGNSLFFLGIKDIFNTYPLEQV